MRLTCSQNWVDRFKKWSMNLFLLLSFTIKKLDTGLGNALLSLSLRRSGKKKDEMLGVDQVEPLPLGSPPSLDGVSDASTTPVVV